VSKDAAGLLADFGESRLVGEPPFGASVAAVGEELHEIPAGAPQMGRLRVVRPGLWLGTLLKNRFEPAHTLALALRGADGVDPVVLAPGDAATLAYLRGEAIRAPGSPGWTLVTVDGFPLGWGKRVGDVVKNHYPKGLRWR
jgi:NOL1/NOP2/fmu family ribosome biogenesis protein